MAIALRADERIASAFSDVDAVEQVYVREVGEPFRVFTIIAEDADDVCDAIYDRERELIKEFSTFRFDFNIIARRGRSVSDIIGAMTPAWQRHAGCPTAQII